MLADMTIIRMKTLLVGLAALTQAVAQQTITPTAKDLNKSFDTDAAKWTERFEHEGRAIYDKRVAILDAMALKRAWTWRTSAPAAA